jgi:drug/metabolite transporter (DMT)-like permease
VAFEVALPWLGGGPSLTALDLGLLLGLGTSATLGHFPFTAAYREAPASLLGPVNYMHLVWVAGLGWLAFDHVPDLLSFAGIGLVAAAGMATAFRARPSQS